MAYINVDLSEFTDSELIAEIQYRKLDMDVDLDTIKSIIDRIYQSIQMNQPYEKEIKELIYTVRGRIV